MAEERKRIEQERQQVRVERTQMASERDAWTAERDRLQQEHVAMLTSANADKHGVATWQAKYESLKAQTQNADDWRKRYEVSGRADDRCSQLLTTPSLAGAARPVRGRVRSGGRQHRRRAQQLRGDVIACVTSLYFADVSAACCRRRSSLRRATPTCCRRKSTV